MIKIKDFCGFIFKDHLLSTLVLHMHCYCFKNFEDLIFMDDKLHTCENSENYVPQKFVRI